MLGLDAVEVAEKDADEFADINALHAAIARSISMHHFGPGSLNLPTKALVYAAPRLGFFSRHQQRVEQIARSAKVKL